MKLQDKTASGFWKCIIVSYMMITELVLENVSVGFQNSLCLRKYFRFGQIKVKISQLAILRDRIAVGKT